MGLRGRGRGSIVTRKHAGGVRLAIHLAGMAFLCAGIMSGQSTKAAASTLTVEWHVSGAGADAPGCGVLVNPCRTVSFILPSVSAGDQISITGAITDSVHRLKECCNQRDPAGASIDGNGARVIAVGAGVHVTLSNLTLRNGGGAQNGGLVLNDGTLIISNAVLTQTDVAPADGGAIFNSGTLSISNSTISNNKANFGGGIENKGQLYISTSTIANNRAVEGGGVDNSDGVAHLNRVVVLGNSAATGAGLNNYSDLVVSQMWLIDTAVISNTAQNVAGGISNRGQLSLLNTTVSGNQLPVGMGVAIDHQTGTLSMQYVTVARNIVVNSNGSTAVNLSSTNTISTSVIANSGLENCSGNPNSAGYNLSSDATCGFIQPTDLSNTDARLGPVTFSSLAYGTMTNPPAPGSALVNRIPAAVCGIAHDQRGIARPQDGDCDIGAHEVIPVNLSMTVQVMPASLPAGTPISVQLNVSNAGPGIATDVVVTSEIPAGVVLSGCSIANACAQSGNLLTMTLGILNPGANAILTAQLTPQLSGDLSLAFIAGSNEWDSQTANNTATIDAAVLGSADVSMILSGPPGVLTLATFTLTAQVENKSEIAADGTTFTLTLPATVAFVKAAGQNWVCDHGAGEVTCTHLSPLQPMSIAPPVNIVLISGNAPATLEFVGSASSSVFDPVLSNNTTGKTLIVDDRYTTFLPVVVR